MAAINPQLIVKLGLDSAGLSKGIKSVKSNLMGLAKEANTGKKHVDGLKASLGGIWRITGGILLFNVIRHITHSIRDLIGTVLDFETQMYNVNSVAHLTAGELKNLESQVLDLALDKRIKEGPAQLAAGLYTIVSAGYSTADALVVMEQAALASTAGMTTSAVAADVLISTLGAYNLKVDDAAKVTNQLFQIVNISKYTFEDLAAALDSVTPTAAALGIGIDNIGAAMATMAQRGVDAQTATVQMNAILSAMLKPTDAMTEALHSLGYETGQQMIQALGFTKTMQVWEKVLGGDAGKAAELFGDVRALRGIMNLTNDGAVSLTKNLELMGHAQDNGGATTLALNEQMKATSFQLAVLRKNFQVLAILGFGLFASHLNKALVGINTFVAGAVGGFKHFHEKGYGILAAMRAGIKKTLMDMFGPDTTRTVLKFFDLFVEYFIKIRDVVQDAWGPVSAILGFVIDHFNIFGPLILGAIVGLKLFAIALGIVNIVMAITDALASPLTLTLIAIAAIGALFAVAWINNWGGIQEKTKVAIDIITSGLKLLWKFISPVIDAVVTLGRYWKKVFSHDIEPGNLSGIPGWLQPIALITGRVVKSIRVFIVTWKKLGALAAFKTLPVQIRAFGRAMAKVLDMAGLHNYAKIYVKVFNDISYIVRDVIELVDDLFHGRWKQAWGDFIKIVKGSVRLLWDYLHVVPALLRDIFNMIPWGKLFRKGFALLWAGAVWIINNLIIPGLAALPGVMVDLIVAQLRLFYNVGRDVISWIWTGIASLWNWIKGQISNLPGALLQSITWALSYFYNFGRDIVSWIWTGIASLWGWILNQISLFAKSIKDQIPDWLQKIIGISAGGVVSVVSTTQSVAASSTERLSLESGNSTAASSTSRTFHNTFNIDGSQDPNATAAAILSAMKRAEEGAW